MQLPGFASRYHWKLQKGLGITGTFIKFINMKSKVEKKYRLKPPKKFAICTSVYSYRTTHQSNS